MHAGRRGRAAPLRSRFFVTLGCLDNPRPLGVISGPLRRPSFLQPLTLVFLSHFQSTLVLAGEQRSPISLPDSRQFGASMPMLRV